MNAVKPCVVIPTYHHVSVLDGIVSGLRMQGLPVIVVDDGNEPDDARRIAGICAAHDGVELLRRHFNGGKGAAVLDGIERAEARGFTHALQIDADGQHDLARVADLLRLASAYPTALVVGEPVYDETVPRSRRFARWITHIWVSINTASFRIVDSMCGFRIYPIAATLAISRSVCVAQRMAFDTEILVRLVWRGVDVVTFPVPVTYPPGNYSNFAMWDDNLRLSGMHAKLFFLMLMRLPFLLFSRIRVRRRSSRHWAAIGERGSYAGLWILGAIYKVLGRRVCLVALAPVVFFFFLTGGEQRRGSLLYLRRAHEMGFVSRAPDLFLSFRHFLTFASSAIDKLAAWTGKIPASSVCGVDEGEFDRAKKQGQGAVIFTAHFGNPEVLRAIATLRLRWRINVLVHTAHAVHFNRLVNELSESSTVRVIQVTEVGPDTAILLQEAVANGDWVVMAGDRIPVTGNERISWVPFLGKPAPFPQGPHILAGLLKCPVHLLFCLREGAHHRIYFERFAERVELPRKGRNEAISASVARYAERLESHLRIAPLQWFNFFDFWHPAGLKPPEPAGQLEGQ